jgi:2-C-methyl-D-erythritol 4-phosphate cytidylyltransferase/2-C-methyl-D-erythritol 2,4-cyclodiphosphate synthase
MASSVAAVIVAAGRGTRAGGDLPKQYRALAGEPVIRASLSLFSWHGEVGAVQAVIHRDDVASYEAAAKGLKLMPPVFGGSTRQASVLAGLEALSTSTAASASTPRLEPIKTRRRCLRVIP